jgi:hypothetical protein
LHLVEKYFEGLLKAKNSEKIGKKTVKILKKKCFLNFENKVRVIALDF